MLLLHQPGQFAASRPAHRDSPATSSAIKSCVAAAVLAFTTAVNGIQADVGGGPDFVEEFLYSRPRKAPGPRPFPSFGWHRPLRCARACIVCSTFLALSCTERGTQSSRRNSSKTAPRIRTRAYDSNEEPPLGLKRRTAFNRPTRPGAVKVVRVDVRGQRHRQPADHRPDERNVLLNQAILRDPATAGPGIFAPKFAILRTAFFRGGRGEFQG